MKIKNFEAFAKKVAKRLNTKIVRVSSDRIWFDNYYYIGFDDDEFIYIVDYSNDVLSQVFCAFAYTYNTQKDFFHDFEMVISATSEPEAPEATSEPSAPEATESTEEIDCNTHNEKWHTYVSVYRDLQQTLARLRKCKTIDSYDKCCIRFKRSENVMRAKGEMRHYIDVKLSMQNVESGVWSSDCEEATGYHKSRRYNKSRIDL